MHYIGLNAMWDNIKNNFPIVEDLAEIASDSSKIISALKNTQNLIIKKKIQAFIENLEKSLNLDIKSFMTSIENDENKKTIFLESINKVIDLDDSLQIYILMRLVQEFKNNNDFNYFEKSLYYNIKAFSEDDYNIFYDFCNSLDKPINFNGSYCLRSTDDVTVRFVFNKLENLVGLLNKVDIGGNFHNPKEFCINKNEDNLIGTCYQMNQFSQQLYFYIDEYKKLEEKENSPNTDEGKAMNTNQRSDA